MKQADHIRARHLFEAAQKGDVDLLKEMKNLNNNKSACSLPETVEDADNPEDIVEKFRTVYSSLYNSAPSAIQDLWESLTVGRDAIMEVNKVTGAKVKEATCKMKPGKSDVSAGYSSDALLHGPDILFDCLAQTIRSFLIHGTVTKSLLACAFLPLLKSLKDPAKTDSYRAIAGSSLILKLMDNVILLLWGDLLESDSLQFGFKSKVSTTQCSWLVNEVSMHYVKAGTPVITTLLDCSKAFDKCQFVPLFEKLLKRNLPPVIVRILIYVYKEQEAWVRWGPLRSETFRISNGTRQGSVLSPALFAVYLDDLLLELRSYGLGCYVAGLWVGAVGFADDLLLMAPSRSAMAKMLTICENYALDLNLHFSTDPDPKKSKSKTIFMTGTRLRNTAKPVNLKLYGQDLPWVSTATHLGHELHESADMEHDCKCKRAKFIDSSTNIRETFDFADQKQMLNAVEIYCSDFYGSMLWDLYGDEAAKFFRCWNTLCKLCWDLPRSTPVYFVDNLLSCGFPSIRKQIVVRYVKFFRSLLKSPCKEVAVLARVVGQDASSVTGRNLLNIHQETQLRPTSSPISKFHEILSKPTDVPPGSKWKIPLLEKYVQIRKSQQLKCENTSYIDSLIDSLCST